MKLIEQLQLQLFFLWSCLSIQGNSYDFEPRDKNYCRNDRQCPTWSRCVSNNTSLAYTAVIARDIARTKNYVFNIITLILAFSTAFVPIVYIASLIIFWMISRIRWIRSLIWKYQILFWQHIPLYDFYVFFVIIIMYCTWWSFTPCIYPQRQILNLCTMSVIVNI